MFIFRHAQLKNAIVRLLALLLSFVVAISFSVDICNAVTTKKGQKTAKKTVEMPEPSVTAGSYVVMSGSTSEVVVDGHADRKMPMGNITKLMTAMVVIDNLHDEDEYDNRIEISKKVDAYGDIFKQGESVRLEDLLKAMLIGCSDEAAEALARYSASKRAIFISEMNSKAMEIGLMSTQYSNPTGKYSPDHYSTALESAIVAQNAFRYAKIKELLGQDMTTIDIAGKKKSRSVVFTNSNPLLSSTKTSEQYRYIKGGIMGTLSEPQELSQYVGIAVKSDMQYVVVLLEAKEDMVSKEAIDLFEYGDTKASKNTIVKADKCVGHARVRGGARTKIKAYTETKGFAYIPPEGSTDLVKTQVVMTSGLTAPLKAGDKVGEYRIYVADELKGTVDLVIKKDVPKGWPLSKLYISNVATVIVVLLVAVIAFFLARVRAKNKRKAALKARARQQKIRELAEKQEALDEDRRNRKWTYSKYYDSEDINNAIKRKKK